MATSQAPKRKFPLLARHAISLAVVFVLALPLSYLGVRYYAQQQKLAQLDQAEDEAFKDGLAYIYTHASNRPAVAERATARIAALPPGRAVELHRVLLRAYVDNGVSVPRSVVDRGIGLMGRIDMPEAVRVYRHTQNAGFEDDPALRVALDRHLAINDELGFIRLVEFYDSQGIWSQAEVPREAWLRWVLLLSESPAETTQRQTARRLGDMPDQANNPAVQQALTRLSQSEYSHVRAQVLKTAAGFAAIADDPTAYEQIIFTLGEDENKVIARRAWLVVGHLNPYSGFSPDWQTADPYVAEAILWAAVKTNPDLEQPLRDAITQGLMPQALLAGSAGNPDYIALLKTSPEELPELAGQTLAGTAAWRFILSSKPSDDQAKAWDRFLVDQYYLSPDRTAYDSDEAFNLDEGMFWDRYYAAAYRRHSTTPPSVSVLRPDDLPKVELAALEGWILDREGDHPMPNLQFPFTQMLAATELADASGLAKFLPLLNLRYDPVANLSILSMASSGLDGLRPFRRGGTDRFISLAALAAGINQQRPSLIRVSIAFLRDNPEITDDQLHAMSDDELSGYDLKRVDAVQAMLNIAENNPDPAERYETTSLLKLALWMRGDLGDEFTARAEGMLFDPRLPTSTVLLALLHKRRPIALEYLFGDLVEPAPDLRQLFIQERFWHVFRRFVETDDLDLWLWGDPAAQDFQLQAMRQWYWVNRWSLDDVWVEDEKGN